MTKSTKLNGVVLMSGMIAPLRLVLSVLALCLAAASVQAANNELTDIQVTSLPGDRVQLTLVMSQPADNPVSFTIDNPARIAMDLTNTQNTMGKRSHNIGVGVARSVNTVQAGGRTRVVVNLAQMVPYETRVDGNNILVTLDSGGQTVARAPRANKGSAGVSATPPRAASAGADIREVDFRRGERGEGRVIITMSDPSTAVDIREEGGKIVADFLGARLPHELERRLDVLDFATPVKIIDTVSRGTGARMVISTVGEFDHLAYQSENVYTIEVKALTKEEKAAARKKKFGYTGERLSLSFQSIEVRAVLQLLADFTGLNIVVSDSVQGHITLRLKNVPWDQALDIILKTKGLDKRQAGNVMLVAPSEEIAAREKLELESQKQIKELAPLRTEWFQINYAKAGDIASLLKGEKNSLLSERGSITIDERTNTLLIQDTASQLEDIRKIVARLDIPVRQVLIESRIVIASDDFSKSLGVKFGVAKRTAFDNGERFAIAGGKEEGDVSFSGPQTGFVPADGAGGSQNPPEDLIVNLPANVDGVGKASLGLAVGKLGSALLQLELSAMQSEGEGEIVSSPRVVTANQKEAVIKQGVEIPFQTEAGGAAGGTDVEFKEAVLSLQVTPQITPDDRIIMDLIVKKDSPSTFNNQTTIDTNEVSTQVLVNNGETVVLGGIYEQTKTRQINRVPFFGELPVLGFLFRSKDNIDNRSELLIFVTPKIIKEQFSQAVR